VLREEDGQATVELVGVLPALLVSGLVAWQLVLAGHAAWLAADAARVAARAEVVGEDPVRAARSALPAGLERGLVVDREGSRTRVRVRVPSARRAWGGSLAVEATASLEASP
jgi:hypothetical protein